MWSYEDPRNAINKRAKIIILRPSMIPGVGFVDTKDGWYIHTSFDDHKSVDVWDELWCWAFAPKEWK